MREIHAENAPAPSGAYVPAIHAGEFLFVSGQGPFEPSTGELAGPDIETQVRATIENIGRIVAAAGGSLRDVVRVDAYLADIDDFPAYDRAYRQAFGGHLPARTTVQAGLGEIRVEISAIAHIGAEGGGR
jgi:2-iminobutanoate/2-iminopropanoate deaminase